MIAIHAVFQDLGSACQVLTDIGTETVTGPEDPLSFLDKWKIREDPPMTVILEYSGVASCYFRTPDDTTADEVLEICRKRNTLIEIDDSRDRRNTCRSA